MNDPLVYGTGLQSLAEALLDTCAYAEAATLTEEGIQLGRELSSPKLLSEHECSLARAYLMTGQVDLAKAAADRAGQFDVRDNRHRAFALLGIASALRKRPDEARRAFTAVLRETDGLTGGVWSDADALVSRALALCGLVVTEPSRKREALEAVQRVAGLPPATGMRSRFESLLNMIQGCDVQAQLRDTVEKSGVVTLPALNGGRVESKEWRRQ